MGKERRNIEIKKMTWFKSMKGLESSRECELIKVRKLLESSRFPTGFKSFVRLNRKRLETSRFWVVEGRESVGGGRGDLEGNGKNSIFGSKIGLSRVLLDSSRVLPDFNSVPVDCSGFGVDSG